jgi:hypothetical protein
MKQRKEVRDEGQFRQRDEAKGRGGWLLWQRQPGCSLFPSLSLCSLAPFAFACSFAYLCHVICKTYGFVLVQTSQAQDKFAMQVFAQ